MNIHPMPITLLKCMSLLSPWLIRGLPISAVVQAYRTAVGRSTPPPSSSHTDGSTGAPAAAAHPADDRSCPICFEDILLSTGRLVGWLVCCFGCFVFSITLIAWDVLLCNEAWMGCDVGLSFSAGCCWLGCRVGEVELNALC